LQRLLSAEWSIGAGYRYTRSELGYSYPTLKGFVGDPSRTEGADLQEFHLQLLYNHSSGLFGSAESIWFVQNNHGYGAGNVVHTGDRPSESTYQVNLAAGYRFWRRRGQLTIACLNLTDQDYRLNSLTPYADLPRERTFAVRLRLNF
jgi:hypothetical protein